MSNTNYVGTVEGRFSVDMDGGAVYAIPIRVPPGTAGMMPGLSVVYNSGGSNGPLGVGCGLQGLSSITRCPQTIAQDGARGAVTYGPGDRFALDGQRLMVVNGVDYDDPGAIYHTELESWQKVVPVYQQSRPPGRSGPDGFLVYSRDGKVLEYGTVSDAQVVASASNPSIRVWALKRSTGAHGNYVTITYEPDPGPNANSADPVRIDYTANDAAGLAAQRSVNFSYEPRPDILVRFQGGSPYATTRRLTGIATALGGQPVLSYAFAYGTGVATGRSHLASVTQSDAGGAALPPTVLAWQDTGAELFNAAQTLPAVGAPWQGQLLPMDVNGDGRSDLVNLSSDGDNLQVTLFLSDGAGFAAGVVLPTTQIPFAEGVQVLPLDIDGNGCIDLICATQNGDNLGLTALMAQPDGNGGWTLAPGLLNGAGPMDLPWGGTLLATDVDGDGLTDLVYAYQDGESLALAILFSNGRTFAPSSTDLTAPSVDYSPGASFQVLDINGDGMSDLVYLTQNGDYLEATLFLSQGRDGLIQEAISPLPGPTVLPASGVLLALDVNGDGLGDLVQAYLTGDALVVQTLVSNGVGFEPPVSQSSRSPASAMPSRSSCRWRSTAMGFRTWSSPPRQATSARWLSCSPTAPASPSSPA
jgi:hypothetical protein